MYHSKKIGIFVSHIFGAFQTGLCQGIIDKAAEYGYNVEIFASLDGENLGNYSIGENSVLRIPNFHQFCGIVFASGTYLSKELCDKVRSALTAKCYCPVIEINPAKNTFPYILLENNQPFSQLVSHLIEEHHYKRICYLGYAPAEEFNAKRLEACRLALQSHHLEIKVKNCDGSEAQIKEALSAFLEDSERPDAIVCYNDNIALHLIRAILEKGLRVPEDIAVTGCDSLQIGQEINPRLTTISFPVYEMGTTAVELLIQAGSGHPLPPRTIVQAAPVYASSCGCPPASPQNSYFLAHRLMNQIAESEDSLFEDMNMSACLQGITDIDEGMDLLEQYASNIPNCRELYLCLYQDWDSASKHILELTSNEKEDWENKDTISLKFAMKERNRLPECTFLGQSTLPEFLDSKASHAYLYFPLFFGEKAFGYLALSYENNRISSPFRFISWIKNVNSMLKSICDTRHMSLLVNRLEDIYMKDELTGLYNRQGFLIQSEKLLSTQAFAETSYATIVVEVDGLQLIRSAFGHTESNFALQVTGHALENATGGLGICAHADHEKFYILSPAASEQDAIKLTDKIHNYLEHYNILQTRKYKICVSTGFVISAPSSMEDIEAMLAKAELLIQKQEQQDKTILR